MNITRATAHAFQQHSFKEINQNTLVDLRFDCFFFTLRSISPIVRSTSSESMVRRVSRVLGEAGANVLGTFVTGAQTEQPTVVADVEEV